MHVTVAECSQGKSEDMLTRRGRDTGTNDLDGTEQPYNPVREDGSGFLPFLLPSVANRIRVQGRLLLLGFRAKP